jgi:cyclophilin family peptidyl-prolyl cis-trans isomerase
MGRMVIALVACALLFAPHSVLAAGKHHAPANPQVSMVVEKRGTIVIELNPKAAPKTVAHFLSLVNKHFYDGILFHRYEAGFVIQGGDPASKKVNGADIANLSSREAGEKYQLGIGGSGTNVPLEATLPHNRGTIGLARSQDPNSGDSQFFFNLVDNHRLDNGYCVFGKVVKGMDVMDKLRQGDRIKTIRVVSASSPKKK